MLRIHNCLHYVGFQSVFVYFVGMVFGQVLSLMLFLSKCPIDKGINPQIALDFWKLSTAGRLEFCASQKTCNSILLYS